LTSSPPGGLAPGARNSLFGDCRIETGQLAPDPRSPSRSGNPSIFVLWAGCRDEEGEREN
jgi:hypothetical protein